MKHALSTIRAEHRKLAAILHNLHDQVERLRGDSAPPDFAGLRAMLYFLDAFSARMHHPKEDEFLFQPLRARDGETAAIIDDLEREHACGAAAMRSLEQALLRYDAGGEREFADFAAAVEGFCAFYMRHMDKEETLVMPLAESLFSDEDWARIDAACAAAGAPHGGVDEEKEFRQLFRRIVRPASATPGKDPPAPQP
ncbi:MAG: hemerythrin domain-containing protein [Burkholderiales bacterium]|nr:hemerythrin domain-containing protein [Burkholderiales bacterium]